MDWKVGFTIHWKTLIILSLAVKHSALEKKEIEWERKVACLDKSNSNLREQLDAVERGCTSQGEVTIETCATRKMKTRQEEGEGPSRKRLREEWNRRCIRVVVFLLLLNPSNYDEIANHHHQPHMRPILHIVEGLVQATT